MEHFKVYFLDNIKNRYASFNGRARRSEYWYFILYCFLISIIAKVIDAIIVNPLLGMRAEEVWDGGFLQVITALMFFIPTITIGIRRLHDIGKKGWWMLVCMVPVIGFIVLLYFYTKDSQSGENIYGPNPKE